MPDWALGEKQAKSGNDEVRSCATLKGKLNRKPIVKFSIRES
jgi:hypothetical protein